MAASCTQMNPLTFLKHYCLIFSFQYADLIGKTLRIPKKGLTILVIDNSHVSQVWFILEGNDGENPIIEVVESLELDYLVYSY